VSANHSNYRLFKIQSLWCGCYCCYLKVLSGWICSGGDGSLVPTIVMKSLKMQFETNIYFFNIWYSIKHASFRREFQNDWSLSTNLCMGWTSVTFYILTDVRKGGISGYVQRKLIIKNVEIASNFSLILTKNLPAAPCSRF
jgi:hypothetical protein